jgi:hypothetical protein
MVGLCDRQSLCVMRGPFLTPIDTTLNLHGIDVRAGMFLLPPYRALRDELALMWFDSDGVWSQIHAKEPPRKARLGWRPEIPEGSSLTTAPFSWLLTGPVRVELAALRADGTVCWARLQLEGEYFSYTASQWGSGYLAVALVREGLLAAVRHDRIVWIRCGPNDMGPQSAIPLDASGVVACFSCRVTNELILVGRDCNVGRLAISS